MTLSALLLLQLFLGFLAWGRGWRAALVFWMVLPWTVVAADGLAPGWIEHAPAAVTAAGLGIGLAFASLSVMCWIAVANPQSR